MKKMKGKSIVKELVEQRNLYGGEGKFVILEEARKILVGKTVTIRYPNGRMTTALVTDVYASDSYLHLFSIKIADGEYYNVSESTEVIFRD